ncbi:KPN_02809 family neutral zinc metallopeptidase [Chitinimonas sp.]|uniref:KPN_02809 family neutral zinc metallopeptidase n=1 Tax=Chitinimonas sp. TaxID=1934313 RepID=UPI002F94E5B6
MRLDDMDESDNVEDVGDGGRGGGGGGLPLGGIGIVGVLAAAGISYFFNVDFGSALHVVSGVEQATHAPAAPSHAGKKPDMNDPEVKFAARVLKSTENVWDQLFAEQGLTYRKPKLALFRNGVRTQCGFSSSAVGPFYCAGDEKVFIDLAFLDKLQQKLGAQGEFARGYVIAHEVGHHVSHLLGTLDKAHQQMAGESRTEANRESVKLELQADCFAGIWGHYVAKQNRLEPGEAEQALRAAHQVGDDTLQEAAGRQVQPESFNHGSAEQRMRWFQRGFDAGRIEACDTFSTAKL